MRQELDNELWARDAYDGWKHRIKAAAESVRVFTPYFDSSLHRLLSNCTLESDALTVVTDLSPETGAVGYRKQLLAARVLLKRGIQIRSLPRLHAKVLVCDRVLVTVGSQNFTSYARGSRETTEIHPRTVDGTEFLETLDEWFSEATVLNLEMVERLIQQTEVALESLRAAHLALVHIYEVEWVGYLAELEAERLRRESLIKRTPYAKQLALLVSEAKSRQARESVWARLQEAGGSSYFYTFRAEKDSTFTTWRARDHDGRSRSINLARLDMHPIILGATGRMGFVRLGDQQISYVRESVVSSDPLSIGGLRLRVSVQLPRNKLDDANIVLALSTYGRHPDEGYELRVRFDGARSFLSSWNPRLRSAGSASVTGTGPDGALLRAFVERLHHDEHLLGELISKSLRPFKFKTLNIYDTNADEFFPKGWLQVTLVDYHDSRILVVTST